MPGTLRWGILGPGGIAGAQASDLVQSGFTISAVGSRSRDSAAAFAAKYGIPNVHEGYEALVADPEVDIIYVATPHSFHYEQARLALAAGKHVLVEKAFTVTREQAEILAKIAKESGLVLLEAMWTRYLPHMVRLREVIAAGTIGEVRMVVAEHLQKLPSDPSHRLRDPALAGGALLDLGIYPISFAWDILGAPDSVLAQGSLTETGVDRQVAVILGYEGGKQASIQMALDAAGPNVATVIGTDGWIELDSTWYTPTTVTVRASDGSVLETFNPPVTGRGMQFQAAEMERLIEAGLTEGEILPVSETAAIMGTLDEVRRQIGLEYPADIMAV